MGDDVLGFLDRFFDLLEGLLSSLVLHEEHSSQIDLYTGWKALPWKILGSGTMRSRSVAAYVVTDPAIVKPLKAAHLDSARAAAAE